VQLRCWWCLTPVCTQARSLVSGEAWRPASSLQFVLRAQTSFVHGLCETVTTTLIIIIIIIIIICLLFKILKIYIFPLIKLQCYPFLYGIETLSLTLRGGGMSYLYHLRNVNIITLRYIFLNNYKLYSHEIW
jgi:hypothetical protein